MPADAAAGVSDVTCFRRDTFKGVHPLTVCQGSASILGGKEHLYTLYVHKCLRAFLGVALLLFLHIKMTNLNENNCYMQVVSRSVFIVTLYVWANVN